MVATAITVVPNALAHATLLETTPADRSVVRVSPKTVTLRFSENVEASLGSVRVYDGQARRVDGGELQRPSGDVVEATIPKRLADGTYTVAWRVISADGHPVHGAFVFSVGKPGANPAGIGAEVLAGEATPTHVAVGFWVVRFLSLVLVLALAGGSFALAVALGAAELSVRRSIVIAAAVLAALLALVSLAGIAFEGAEAGGFGVVRALHWDVYSSVLDTRFGEAWLARACVAALAVLVAVVVSRRPDRRGAVALAVVCACLVPTLTVSGHASVGGRLELVADLVHASAAAIWTGGLTVLVVALLLAGAGRWQLARSAVPRFSTMALASVAALLAAGLTSAYLEVRAWAGLWETTYGRLLLVKSGLLLGLLALGAYNRTRSVPAIRSDSSSPKAQRGFFRAVSVELVLMVVVVGVTASLIAQPPAKAYVAPSGPFTGTTQVGPYELDLVVDPATTGANEIHLYLLDRTGRPAKVAEASVAASYPAASIGPLHFRSHPAGPGHYIVPVARLPLAGDWRIAVTARRGEFDEWTGVITTPIRKGSSP